MTVRMSGKKNRTNRYCQYSRLTEVASDRVEEVCGIYRLKLVVL
jgi:hypothetical protein